MKKKPAPPLKVIELFAGVGGFREAMSTKKTKDFYKVIWSNQWEPKESNRNGDDQTANKVYSIKYPGKTHHPHDIESVTKVIGMPAIPDEFDLLVGGFPCQDYSVAKPRNASEGMMGPKGILWWRICEILKSRRPRLVLLENVDLLVKSPSDCRGKDFAIILKCLDELGYFVEWRVINAGDYGYIQRRRRTYIFAYIPSDNEKSKYNLIEKLDVKSLRCNTLLNKVFEISNLAPECTYNFNRKVSSKKLKKTYKTSDGKSPFKAAGMMACGKCISADHDVPPGHRSIETLRDALLKRTEIKDYDTELERYKIHGHERIEAWKYVKGRKDEVRRKLQPLEAYVRKVIGRNSTLTPAKIKELAKSLPQKLSMDVLIESPEGEFKLLTREDVNSAVRAALSSSEKGLSPPEVLTHKSIKQVLECGETKLEVIAKINILLKNRSIPAIALEALERLGCKKVKSPNTGLTFLTEDNATYVERVNGKSYKFERDAASHVSIAYRYQEGSMTFPDPLDKPSRTIITSEGGPSVSRFKHVICELCAEETQGHIPLKDCLSKGKLRRLHPAEIEKLNGFPAKHSMACVKANITPNKRIMLMGNAVVVDLLEDIFVELAKRPIPPPDAR
jgi:DNA (cytosine-5)-methyltransferase 1